MVLVISTILYPLKNGNRPTSVQDGSLILRQIIGNIIFDEAYPQ